MGNASYPNHRDTGKFTHIVYNIIIIWLFRQFCFKDNGFRSFDCVYKAAPKQHQEVMKFLKAVFAVRENSMAQKYVAKGLKLRKKREEGECVYKHRLQTLGWMSGQHLVWNF